MTVADATKMVGAQSAVGSRAEDMVLHLLIQLIVIIACSRLVVALITRLGQTEVSGEILAGLLLGPSALGAIAPQFMQRIFDPSTSTIFVGLAQLGLVLLMFQIGLEFDFKHKMKGARPVTVAVSLSGILLPFLMGYLTAPWFYLQFPDPRPPMLGFRLFFAVAMSITAIPVLGRIFMELDLSHTRIAALTIGAAAIDDVVGWLLLGVVTLIVQGQLSVSWLATRLGLLVAYVALVLLVARPWLKRAISHFLHRHSGRPHLDAGAISVLLLILFASGTITSSIGVFAIIGGFIIGVALHDDREFVEEWKKSISPLVNTLLLPIFFAYTGLRTDIGSLAGAKEWAVCLAVMGIAFTSKFGGAYSGARLAGETHRDSIAIGVCMNTRALMELIAINIGYDRGMLPRSMFTCLVLMAILSTFIATPLIRWLVDEDRKVASDFEARREPWHAAQAAQSPVHSH